MKVMNSAVHVLRTVLLPEIGLLSVEPAITLSLRLSETSDARAPCGRDKIDSNAVHLSFSTVSLGLRNLLHTACNHNAGPFCAPSNRYSR